VVDKLLDENENGEGEKQARISRYAWTVQIASAPIDAGTKSILIYIEF
jgi:hypothetical protein